MKPKTCFMFSIVAACCVLAALFATGSAHAQKVETIALYDFKDTTSIFKDVGGKNISLSNPKSGVTQSTTEYSTAAPTTVSAYFGGAQTDGGARQINFSTYTALTFDWHMKADAEANRTNTLFQSGYQSDLAGAVVIQLNWNAQATAATLHVVHRLTGAAKWAMVDFAITDPSSWKNYTLTIDNSVLTTTGHISLLLDGIAQTASTSRVDSGESVTGKFLTNSQYSYLGKGPTASPNPFKGYLQNFEIYSGTPTPVPEISSISLLIGLASFVTFALLRRR